MTDLSSKLASRVSRLTLLLSTLAFAGCTVLTDTRGVSYQNAPDTSESFVRPAIPVPRSSGQWGADKPTFVGVAVSGGGSRSANFGMAVLTELDQLGVLEHVDALSAVSGGTLPSAYFALYGDKPDWSEKGRQVMATNFVYPLLGKLANPVNLVSTTFTDRDRTDALAELFEDKIFDGKRVTFADLGPRGPMRPSIYFNATDTTAGGTRFVFTDETFFRTLGSDLSSYPLTWAMASSGAFPGIFNSTTLRRYSVDPAARKTSSGYFADSRYVHLIDGGPSDNLGVETLVERAREHHVNRLNAGLPTEGCMLIVVDSHVPNAGASEARMSDRRNTASMLLDLNFLDAIDAMLSSRRDQTLTRLGVRRDIAVGQFNVELGPGLWEYKIRPYRRVSRFMVDYFYLDGHAFTDARFVWPANALNFSNVAQPERRQFECMVWHVALDAIHSVVPTRMQGAKVEQLSINTPADKEVFAYRARLARLLSQVATSYKLTGPPHCTEPQVQQALYDAAHIAVRQDHASVEPVCKWFTERKLVKPERCQTEASPLVRHDLQVLPILMPRSLTELEQNTDRFVMCPAPPQTTDSSTNRGQ